MTMQVYANSNHTEYYVTCSLRSLLVVFLNNTPIYCILKKQKLCDTITYGSELVSTEQACEYVHGLWYNIRIMGIMLDETTLSYGDKHYVLDKTNMPVSTLNKKSNVIVFHFVQ